jgi:hypothetical protein
LVHDCDGARKSSKSPRNTEAIVACVRRIWVETFGAKLTNLETDQNELLSGLIELNRALACTLQHMAGREMVRASSWACPTSPTRPSRDTAGRIAQLVSTSHAAGGAFAPHFRAIVGRYARNHEGVLSTMALSGLWLRLPNLRRLHWRTCSQICVTPSLLRTVVAEWWSLSWRWTQGTLTLGLQTWAQSSLQGSRREPHVERLYMGNAFHSTLFELSKGLKGGGSPHLMDLECACK